MVRPVQHGGANAPGHGVQQLALSPALLEPVASRSALRVDGRYAEVVVVLVGYPAQRAQDRRDGAQAAADAVAAAEHHLAARLIEGGQRGDVSRQRPAASESRRPLLHERILQRLDAAAAAGRQTAMATPTLALALTAQQVGAGGAVGAAQRATPVALGMTSGAVAAVAGL